MKKKLLLLSMSLVMVASSLVACGNLNGQTEETSENDEAEAKTEPVTEEKELTETEIAYQNAYDRFKQNGITNPALIEDNMINWGLDDPELIQQMFADLGIEIAEEDEEEANEELNIAQVPIFYLMDYDPGLQYYYNDGKKMITQWIFNDIDELTIFLGTDDNGFDYFFNYEPDATEYGRYLIFKNVKEFGEKGYGKNGYLIWIDSHTFDNYKGVDYMDIVKNGEPEEWGVVFDALHDYYLKLEANGDLQKFETFVFD